MASRQLAEVRRVVGGPEVVYPHRGRSGSVAGLTAKEERALLVDTVEYACSLPIRDGKVLLGMRAPHRRNWPSCWDTIGGHLEGDENPSVALVRELQEEIGVTPMAFEPLGTIETTETDGVTPALWHMFAVTAWDGGDPRLANDEHTELAWFSLEEAERLQPLASEVYRPFFASLRGWLAAQ